ncbi:MAG: glutamate--cysteine ligase [Candidatus Midichloria mitochondrii]|nr:glutamate--cysteine ligase [Candidatus Midichloria mitochondrii]MDJ1256907.1 glutamate--cysteine ligase [Candidatus Midichloria mitochondrii]MDJ1288650.1 glutamate--cysteine ligase [Candidatus Midichloria mitochondrii]MDJ1299483.1 glutamate--cysteine ligase [Candidatus Midichloria mitochondrii]MDJ1313466.1 glutamate--cysteine ligase [Candidatus Midichloria mitochondrii]MDJ1583116.1 glutamate--cysteine ligase [Candidatus Midichloria mitochondrii]
MLPTQAVMSADLNALNSVIKSSLSQIQDWIEEKRDGRNWPIYHSLDLRISNYKICHVDSNLFPGGFHNLSINGIQESIQNFKKILAQYQKILIVIENFTRNYAYFNNVLQLQSIISSATNAEIKLATIGDVANKFIKAEEGPTTFTHALQRKSGKVFITDGASDWYPDFILLNNDLTEAFPEELENIEQKILPDPQHGWHSRKKSNHFKIYNELIEEASQIIKIDPFLISAEFDTVGGVNFRDKIGLKELKGTADQIISRIKTTYADHNITVSPYLFLKSNKGTLGMGILEIQDTDTILTINKKYRHSMHAIKSGVLNDEILIQEGIRTAKTLDGYPAETVIYSVNGEIVGEMIRYNDQKTIYQSLNSSGMKFSSGAEFNIEVPLGYIKWFINKVANLVCIL